MFSLPLPPPPVQAKLDLASVLEESAAAGKKASEAKALLETAQAEHQETKMKLEGEEAANAGLKAAVMEANEVGICMLVGSGLGFLKEQQKIGAGTSHIRDGTPWRDERLFLFRRCVCGRRAHRPRMVERRGRGGSALSPCISVSL